MKHSWYAQTLPLRANRVVCQRCGKIVQIGRWPQGKRASCSATTVRPYKGSRTYNMEKQS